MNFSRTLVKRGVVILKRFKHSKGTCNNQIISQGCEGEAGQSADFDCNICFESCQDPVVTMCGHLFCWSCLYKWLSSHVGFQECPVCKASIEDKIIPLYGRGGTACDNTNGEAATQKPAVTIPSRPAAPRPSQRQNTQLLEFRNHGFSYHRSHLGYGNHIPFPSSAGLFPALFGFQVNRSTEYNTSLPYSSTSFGSTGTTRGTTMMTTTIQPRSWTIHQELILHWSFVILFLFVVACLLLF